MVNFDKKKLSDGSLHLTIAGKIDENFSGMHLLEGANGAKVVMHLAGVRSISSLGVRAFESFMEGLGSREVVMIHISPALASQLSMIPNLCGNARIESAKLPFVCPSCGNEKSHSIPFKAGASSQHAPKCECGAMMELDGLPEHYLPQ